METRQGCSMPIRPASRGCDDGRSETFELRFGHGVGLSLHERPIISRLKRLEHPVELEEGMTAPARVRAMDRRAAGGTWLEIELTEGRNRQVRRMGEAVGHRVLRLHRSRYAGIGLARLAPGRWRPISRAEWARLGASVGLER